MQEASEAATGGGQGVAEGAENSGERAGASGRRRSTGSSERKRAGGRRNWRVRVRPHTPTPASAGGRSEWTGALATASTAKKAQPAGRQRSSADGAASPYLYARGGTMASVCASLRLLGRAARVVLVRALDTHARNYVPALLEGCTSARGRGLFLPLATPVLLFVCGCGWCCWCFCWCCGRRRRRSWPECACGPRVRYEELVRDGLGRRGGSCRKARRSRASLLPRARRLWRRGSSPVRWGRDDVWSAKGAEGSARAASSGASARSSVQVRRSSLSWRSASEARGLVERRRAVSLKRASRLAASFARVREAGGPWSREGGQARRA